MRRRSLCLLLAVAIATGVLAAASSVGTAGPTSAALGPAARDCPEPRLSSRYVRRVSRALRARHDSWGRRLLSAPNGPTFERARRYVTPLFLARKKNGRLLTDSGAHYTHFSHPSKTRGATSVALHVADGSQVITRRAHGRHVTLRVGVGGRERYGSCLRRLAEPTLADGFLPVLRTRYVDRHGVRYRQDSFAARIRETTSLVSFVRLRADARRSRAAVVRLRFTPSVKWLRRQGTRLVRGGRTYAFFSEGATWSRPSLKYSVRRGKIATVYVAWLHAPRASKGVRLDERRFERARSAVERYWRDRLADGGLVVVPERRIVDAQRNVLIQNLGLSWRYSVGNRYEQLSTPEGVDVARVLAAYGHLEIGRSILRTSLRKKRAVPAKRTIRRATNWRMGARLVGFARYAQLAGDTTEIARATPTLRGYVRRLGSQIRSSRTGLLRRERYSSDVWERVYGLHSQAVVWQGLRAMGHVWRGAGYGHLADNCGQLASRLERGLRRAVRRSQRRLRGGALFVPVQLLDGERPYKAVTATRHGSYWNLVMPYALASGFFEPHGTRARGLLRYLDRSGSRLLGRVRTGAFALYGKDARGVGGFSPVYSLNMSRFLADNDRPEQLVLSLYGQLAAEMTPGTYVSGESVSLAPLRGDHYRSTYLPPNGASNAAFLETLRLMLVHETTDRRGLPRGLELAYATPRAWLRPGKKIEVRRLATSFGPLSYTIEAGRRSARVSIDVPGRSALRALRLRLRLPRGTRIERVLVNGRPEGRLLRDGETIVLPTVAGELEVEARLRPGRR